MTRLLPPVCDCLYIVVAVGSRYIHAEFQDVAEMSTYMKGIIVGTSNRSYEGV